MGGGAAVRVERAIFLGGEVASFKPSRCIKASFRISEKWLNFLKPGDFRTKIFMEPF